MHVIGNRDDLVEVLRARKAQIGLSNAYVEHALHMGAGGCDKPLGPSRTKSLSLLVAFDLVELFGGRLVFQIDAALEARMRNRWERRSERNVRQGKRVSRKIMALAQQVFFKRLSKLGNDARKVKLPPEVRSDIARAAATSRWRIHRAAVKARAVAEGA
jgi:hypothetical protein